MGMELTVSVDDRVSRYVQTQVEVEHTSPMEVLQTLVQRGYEREIERLYGLYAQGEITLRGMARRLGISYRELYQVFEEKGLAF